MYHRDSYSDGFGSMVSFLLALALIGLFVLVRVCVFVVRTFVKYPRKVVLWVFLGIFVVSLVASVLLGHIFQQGAWMVIGLAGFAALSLTTYIVELRNSSTFIKQPEPMVKAVLGSSWWSDDTQQVAA